MPLPKKMWEISSFDKGVGNYNIPGMFWWAQNLDFDISPPFMRVANKMFKETDSQAVATLDEAHWSAVFDNTNYIINKDDGKIFRNNPTYNPPWTEVHDNANLYGGLGLFGDSQIGSSGEDGYLYYASRDYAGRYYAPTQVWTDSWQSFLISNNTDHCPIKKFLKFICFGNQQYLAVWDIGASSWDNDRIILPTGYKIKWLQPLSDYLVICADGQGYGSTLFLWDGISKNYNYAVRVPGKNVLAGVVINNVLYALTSDGYFCHLAGNELVNIKNALGDPVRFPDMEIGDTIFVAPDAFKEFNGLIYIGKKSSDVSLSKRFTAGGLWVFNPMTNALYLKNILSNLSILTSNIYSLFVTPTGDTLKVAWFDGTDYKIDSSRSSGNIQPYAYGAVFVSPIYDKEPYRRKRFIQEVVNFFKPLPTGSKILIKQNTTEKYQRQTITATGGTGTYFSVSAIGSEWEIGDEITVMSGGGAGQIRHILSIDSTLNRVTVDEALSDSASFSNSSRIMISAFKKIGEISGNGSVVNKLLRFNARAKKIQLKVELRSGGSWDVGIANLSTIFIPDRIIK